jgi:hypothetical protein
MRDRRSTGIMRPDIPCGKGTRIYEPKALLQAYLETQDTGASKPDAVLLFCVAPKGHDGPHFANVVWEEEDIGSILSA